MPLSYLNSTTLSSLTAAAMGTTANRQYVVGLDANGNLSVNIPWTDHIYNFTGTTFASGNGTTGEHNANNMTYNGSFYIGSGQNNPPVTLGVQNADAAVYVQAYNDQWVVQLAQDYRDGQIFVRSKKQGTWQAWKAVPMFTTTNGAKGSATQPLYIDANGMLQPTTYTLGKSVPADAVFTDTTYTFDGTYNASTNKAATQSTVTSAINALPKRNPNGGVQKVPIDMDTSTGTFSTTITPQDIDEGFTAFEESQPSFTNSSSTVLYIGEQNTSEDNRYKFEAPIVVRYQSIDGFEFQSPIVALDSIGLTGEIGFLYLETYSGYNSPYHLTLTHWPSSSVTNVAYDSSTYNITKTINGTTSNVLQMPCRAGTGTNSLITGDLTNNIASGENSFAAGGGGNISGTIIYQTASGKFSFTAGAANTVSGDSSAAFGIHNTVSNKFSIAFGSSNTVLSQCSFAGGSGGNIASDAHYGLTFGYQNEVLSSAAIALGKKTKANAKCSLVIGTLNALDTGTASDNPFNNSDYKKYAFIIGNGTSDGARSNALMVDWYGSIESGGSLTLGYGGNDVTTLTAAQLKTLISTGTTGQVLTKTASGFAWQSLPTYNGGVS